MGRDAYGGACGDVGDSESDCSVASSISIAHNMVSENSTPICAPAGFQVELKEELLKAQTKLEVLNAEHQKEKEVTSIELKLERQMLGERLAFKDKEAALQVTHTHTPTHPHTHIPTRTNPHTRTHTHTHTGKFYTGAIEYPDAGNAATSRRI